MSADEITLEPTMPPGLDAIARSQIKRWLESTGVTQTSLAEQIGRNQAWMSRYLAAEFDADLDTLDRIAATFNHSVAALLNVPQDPDEARLVTLFRALRPENRKLVLQMCHELTHPGRSRPRTTKR